jgi:BirA family biotin operon repressor/biotin-[acetyl-CoA-carboxylase] ligase
MNQALHAQSFYPLEPAWTDFESALESAASAQGIFPGLKVRVFDTIESTNDLCAAEAQRGARGPLVVLADQQTAGRGRQGSRWKSPPHCNLLMSIMLNVQGLGDDLLALAASLAVADAIERSAPAMPVECRLKWPNDILLADRKVAGILIEKPVTKGSDLAVIGIGVNVNQVEFPPELTEHAVSMAMICGGPLSRFSLARELLTALHHRLSPTPDKNEIAAAWKARCDMLGRRVSLETGGVVISGIVADIDPFEGLVLRQDNGVLRMCHAASSRMVRTLLAT